MGNDASRPAPYTTVYNYFQKWQSLWDLATSSQPSTPATANAIKQTKTLERLNCIFLICENNEKKGEVYGYDGGKKVKDRKHHIVVDSQGLLIGVLVTEANGSERLGALVVLKSILNEPSAIAHQPLDKAY